MIKVYAYPQLRETMNFTENCTFTTICALHRLYSKKLLLKFYSTYQSQLLSSNSIQMLQSKFQNPQQIATLDIAKIKRKLVFFNSNSKSLRSQLDDYQLKEIIGQGGFGEVKKAIHKPTGQTVAVKIFTVETHEIGYYQAIEKEIKNQRHMMHENIAQIYEVIRKDNKVYIFMEYCKNGQLFQKINRHGPLSERQALKIFRQILSALLYMKNLGISHRDVKPENVLFDQKWNVKLVDFGFCCRSGNGEFRKTVCGTPSYTPPEIIKKTIYDPELVDVWCLGVTLYAMLTSKLPFLSSKQNQRYNIINFKYLQQPSLSNRVQKLFSTIFVDAKYRPRLEELKSSQFYLSEQQIQQPNFINFNRQNLLIEDKIIEKIQENYGLSKLKVQQAVKKCQFNRYYAHYFLSLKRQSKTDERLSYNKFKKQKHSFMKLEPIVMTPNAVKKDRFIDKDYEMLNMKTGKFDKNSTPKVRIGKPSVISIKPRLRQDQPDSPRRLLDCLAAYKNC